MTQSQARYGSSGGVGRNTEKKSNAGNKAIAAGVGTAAGTAGILGSRQTLNRLAHNHSINWWNSDNNVVHFGNKQIDHELDADEYRETARKARQYIANPTKKTKAIFRDVPHGGTTHSGSFLIPGKHSVELAHSIAEHADKKLAHSSAQALNAQRLSAKQEIAARRWRRAFKTSNFAAKHATKGAIGVGVAGTAATLRLADKAEKDRLSSKKNGL